MMEPWFAPETGRLFAMMSLLAFASTLEPLARQGRARAAVLTTFASCMALGLACVALAVVGALIGQPNYVIAPMIVAGVAVTLPFAAGFAEMRRIYSEAELRKTIASDL
jgi:arginine exporter protein ArgO